MAEENGRFLPLREHVLRVLDWLLYVTSVTEENGSPGKQSTPELQANGFRFESEKNQSRWLYLGYERGNGNSAAHRRGERY